VKEKIMADGKKCQGGGEEKEDYEKRRSLKKTGRSVEEAVENGRLGVGGRRIGGAEIEKRMRVVWGSDGERSSGERESNVERWNI
jgi:hypothetical protein